MSNKKAAGASARRALKVYLQFDSLRHGWARTRLQHVDPNAASTIGEYGSAEPFPILRKIMRFLRRPAPRARPHMRHRGALQKPCCTNPRAAIQAMAIW